MHKALFLHSWSEVQCDFVHVGQKGIGFKSVFRVTDVPEIHSNGFHIRFDVYSGPLGYILPHWVESEQPSSDGFDE